MQCPECQFENRDEAKFSGECGHKLKITGSKCGTHNQAGNTFFRECEAKVYLKQANEALRSLG